MCLVMRVHFVVVFALPFLGFYSVKKSSGRWLWVATIRLVICVWLFQKFSC